MQLDPAGRIVSVRQRLSAAACVLLAAGVPAGARADPAGAAAPDTAAWQLDATGLIYGEENRANVVEPVARLTRLFPDGQTLSGQFTIDAISGASPTGALPSGQAQTTTSASGTVTTIPAGQIPTKPFRDLRGAVDLEWQRPLGSLFTATTGGHFSREKDYQSLGANVKFSLDVLRRLATLTAGVGYNRDGVFPVGGTPPGLSDGTVILTTAPNPKRVTTGVVGLSRVLTRRWLVGVDASRTSERGYLTEPYKVVSVVDSVSGLPIGQLTDSRPSTRSRNDVLASSVYHLTDDVIYASYRYYWDDWGVRSNTFDVKYRHELPQGTYVEPHLRVYTQTPARFFRFGLVQGAPLPAFATSDDRLGPLRTATLGATFGFHIPDQPGDFTVRGEYIRQWGRGHPADALGAMRQFDLFPAENIGSLVAGYSVQF